jgi:hypothetical protein
MILGITASVKTTVIAFVLGMAIGGVSGFYTKGQFVKADRVDAVVEVRKTDAKSVQKAQETDSQVARNQESKASVISQIKQEYRKTHEQPKQPARSDPGTSGSTHSAPPHGAFSVGVNGFGQPAEQSCGPTRLSRNDVWLFNSAISGAIDRATSPSDAEGKAPSEVTNSAFYEHNLEIIDYYHYLSESHDALVSFVERLQREQRERLGIKSE